MPNMLLHLSCVKRGGVERFEGFCESGFSFAHMSGSRRKVSERDKKGGCGSVVGYSAFPGFCGIAWRVGD